MKFWNLFILGLIALGLVSCAPGPGTSNLKVSVAAVTGSANFPGGLFLLGKSTEGFEFLNRIPASDSIELELPNGKYDFLVIGWDGNKFYEGTPHCGALRNIELAGGELPLNFNVTVSGCHHSDINGVGAMIADPLIPIPPIVFRSCAGLQYYLAMGQDPPSDLLCDGTDDMFSGGENYFQISLIEKTPDGAVKYDSFSACKEVNSASGLNLPIGSTAAKFPVLINAYTDVNCTQNKNSYLFSKGLISVSDGMRGKISEQNLSDVMTMQNIYLSRRECNPLHQEITMAFASKRVESGTDVHLICNKEQFGLIGSHSGEIYELGQDINMNGAASVAILDGSLYGNGYVLYDGTKPLFDHIDTTNSIRVSDIYIDNFRISENSNSGVELGIFANSISSADNAGKIEISNIFISENSKIEFTTIDATGGSSYMVGGFIGNADLLNNNSSSTDSLELRNIVSLADLDFTLSGADTSSGVWNFGGLIGKASAMTDTFKIEYSAVGSEYDDWSTDANRIEIRSDSGLTKTGGFIGQAQSIDFYNVIAMSSIEGSNYIGGLIGDLLSGNNIHDAYTDFEFIPTQDATRIGGMFGGGAGGPLNANGLFARFLIESGSVYKADMVGGILGNTSSGGAYQITNSKVVMNTQIDGQRHGGIVGKYSGGASNNNVTTNGFYCERCLVEGNILEETLNSANIYRGGFGGYVDSAVRMQMSISNMDVIEGHSYVAGGYGYSIESSIWESKISVDKIIFRDSYGADLVGKIELNANASGKYFYKIISDSSLYTPASNLSDASSMYFGKLFGYLYVDQSVSSYTAGIDYFEDIISKNLIKDNNDDDMASSESVLCGASDHPTYCSSTITDRVTGVSNGGDTCTNLVAGPLTTMTMFEDENSSCSLTFEKQWRKYTGSIKRGLGKYDAGSYYQPFGIKVVNDWTGIGTDAFLLQQSFILQNDIDFNNVSISELGVFKGRIIPNGKILKNAVVDSSQGLIHSLDGATIGWYNEPFKLDNIKVNCSNQNCGLFAFASDSNIFVRSSNIEIIGTGMDNIGGLIGYASNRISIKESSFHGKVLGEDHVGGFIGQYYSATNGLEIEDSNVKLNRLYASSDYAGGFVGYHNSTMGFSLKNSYLELLNGDGSSLTIESAGANQGLIMGTGSSSETYVIKSVFADIQKGRVSGIIYDFGKFTGTLLTSTDSNNYHIIKKSSQSYQDVLIISGGLSGGFSVSDDAKTASVLDSDYFSFEDEYSNWKVDSNGNVRLWWE